MLNKPAYRNAKILVAGDNFGCGSSREHAPWALMDFGIRCVISTSFGDIFYNNCFKNGVLPIKVSTEDLEKLFDDAERGANATLSIDLAKQEIRGPDGGVVKFEIDPHRKQCLLNGLDDIGLTMVKNEKIEQLREKAEGRACVGVTRRLSMWDAGVQRQNAAHVLRTYPARSSIACAIATVRRAMSACRRSTMRPSSATTPLPLFSGSSKAAIILLRLRDLLRGRRKGGVAGLDLARDG